MMRSKKRKLARLRTDEATARERAEREAQRAHVGASLKKVRKRQGVGAKIKQHDQLLAALLIQLRNLVADIQTKHDVIDIVQQLLTKAALGTLTAEEREVLEDFQKENAPAEPEETQPVATAEQAADAGPRADIQAGG